MGGIQMGNFMKFAEEFDFSKYETLCDLGGAGGYLSAEVVKKNPHMKCITFDLPQVEPIAVSNIGKMKLSHQVSVKAGDFFKDAIPDVDVITMGNVLHDWGEKDKKNLIRKSYDALNPGGSLVVIENIIDDERKENAFGLMMSLNMLIETDEGFDFSAADFDKWAKDIGFQKTTIMPLTGPASAVIATK